MSYSWYYDAPKARNRKRAKMMAGAIAMLAAFLCMPGTAWSQTPAPSPSRGGVLLAYATGHEAPDTGRWGVEADLRVAGTPLLIVGHVTDGSGGIGPKVQHNIGPITLYGHTLFGTFETGADAMTDSQIRHGAGVEIPIRDGAFVRIGVEHTPVGGASNLTATSVGFGWRF